MKTSTIRGHGGDDQYNHQSRLNKFIQHKRMVAKYTRLVKGVLTRGDITPHDVTDVMKKKWGKNLIIHVDEHEDRLVVTVTGVATQPTTYDELCEVLNRRKMGGMLLELLLQCSPRHQSWEFVELVLDDQTKGPRASEWELD